MLTLQEDFDDDVTPLETPAWRRMSLQAPYFAELAEKLSVDLHALNHRVGRMMSLEALNLARDFREWVHTPPTDDERRKLIDDMCQFNSLAISLLQGSR
jgi:hypothetical protein